MEHIVARSPDDKMFTNWDYDYYTEIMHSTNALWRNNDERETKRKANRSWKWKHVLKPDYDENYLHIGNGITPSVPTIILPCDAIALVKRLDILMASKAAENRGIWNELVTVCDEFLRQNLIDKQKYKIKIMTQL